MDIANILDSLPVMVICIKPAGEIVYANKEWKKIFTTECIRNVIHPDDLNIFQDMKKTVQYKSESKTTFEQRMSSTGDNYMTYSVCMSYNEDDTYSVVCKKVLSTKQDEKWQDITDNLPISIFTTNDMGHVSYYNQYCTYTVSSMERDGYFEMIHPDDRQRVKNEWNHALKTKEQYKSEHRLLTDPPNSDEYKWYMTIANYLERKPFGISWLGVVIDVDKQYRTLYESRIVNMRFEVMMQNVHCVFFCTDSNGVVEYVTGRALGKFNDIPPIKEGDNLLDHILEEDKDRFHRIIKNETTETFESRFYDKVYSNIWLKDTSSNGLMALSFDITDDIRLRQEKQDLLVQQQVLMSVNRIKTRFLTNMSHELRTPLTAIMGLTELLKVDSCANAECKEYLDMIIENTKNLSIMVDDMLDIGAIEGGTFDVSNDKIVPSSLLEEIKSYFGYQAKQKGINVIINLSEDVPQCIITDKKRLRQILQYLMSNAIKFTNHGTIQLYFGIHNSQLHLTIQDTGCGISDALKPRLFQPFTIGDESNSRKYGGSGLGLYITKMILDSMHGRINISSQVNKGTLVTVMLPFTPCLPYTETHTSTNGSFSSGNIQFSQNTCILVAEDNRINQTIVKKICERYAIQVRIANNGQEAIQLINSDFKHEISLVLMDIQMPILDGIEAFKYIHAKDPSMPVIAMTANALESDKQYHLEIGMVDHISKPFTSQQLMKTISKYLPKAS